MKKRIFALAISAALLMTLAACGTSSDSGTSSAQSSEAASSSESAESSEEASTAEMSEPESGTSSEESGESTVLGAALERVKSEVELPDDMADFDERRLKRVFGITDELAEDFSGAICTDGLRQDEFIYVKAKDEDSAKEIADKLQSDWQSKYNVIKNYDPDQVEIIEAAEVETNGLYVSLVISEQAEQIKQIYSEAIGS